MDITNFLNVERKNLLDPSARNRLINTPLENKSRNTWVRILDFDADAVYKHLVDDENTYIFLPSDGSEDSETGFLNDDYGNDSSQTEHGVSSIRERVNKGIKSKKTYRTTSRKKNELQTNLIEDNLNKRLLTLYRDSETLEQEQGVNHLFLAVGFLKYFEDDNSKVARYAPLILLPVKLKRASTYSGFSISIRDEELTTNLSLKEKIKSEFNVTLPDLATNSDGSDIEFIPSDYFRAVEKSIRHKSRWQVLENESVMWFYSFTKFLMYRDLIPETWPEENAITEHGNIKGFLEGFLHEPSLFNSDDDKIDNKIRPSQSSHVVDADSSQAVVIEEVRQGRNLVVQGPPGTGKSQTILNILATAVKDGKSILFISEKMAALEVVKKRLDDIGLGRLCLELHSNKTDKKKVLEEIKSAYHQTYRSQTNLHELGLDLESKCNHLNRHAESLHTKVGKSNFSMYQALGKLVGFRRQNIPTPTFIFNAAKEWSSQTFEDNCTLVSNFQNILSEIKSPIGHTWHGVGLSQRLLHSDVDRLISKMAQLTTSLKQLTENKLLRQLVIFFKQDNKISFRIIEKLIELTKEALSCPILEMNSSVDVIAVWKNRSSALNDIVDHGFDYSTIHSKNSTRIDEDIYKKSLSRTREVISQKGKSWLRFLSSEYRTAIRTVNELSKTNPPKTHKERIELLDEIIDCQQSLAIIENSHDFGRDAFGDYWKGINSDWQKLRDTSEWIVRYNNSKIGSRVLELAAQLSKHRPVVTQLFSELASNYESTIVELKKLLSEELSVDLKLLFGVHTVHDLSVSDVMQKMTAWVADSNELDAWTRFNSCKARLSKNGLEEIHQNTISPNAAHFPLLEQFQYAYFESLIRESYRLYPSLTEFNGKSHNQLINNFCSLDKKRIELYSQDVLHTYAQRREMANQFNAEMKVLGHEWGKKRRHIPLRKLIKQTSRALQLIKPIFMMSPLSVAQYLEPGATSFDLLVIDEASQVKPVDAMGAFARCNQFVVVGDEKQMPPTNFFSSELLTTDEDSEDDSTRTGDLESILKLCDARRVPSKMLRWHYRSKHHSLIAASNQLFYDNKLIVVPNPEPSMEGSGLKFHYCEDGLYDRGKSATNIIEAQTVVREMIKHARNCPELSLGVGTFSVAQRDVIQDELDRAVRQNPDVEAFFFKSGSDACFIKNLETLQGDERDVIFISVGYQVKDQFGNTSMSFGPIQNEGGERRLNVLFTRARQRCIVFASMKADEIDLSRAKSKGAAALKHYLHYAEKGILDIPKLTSRDFDSDFERHVYEELIALGYEVDIQVGFAGFYIDMAVKDKNNLGRYILGIECDGASYHSSRSARDRDRIRQNILEQRNWRIHRIWSTDWFRNPSEELRRVIDTIEMLN